MACKPSFVCDSRYRRLPGSSDTKVQTPQVGGRFRPEQAWSSPFSPSGEAGVGAGRRLNARLVRLQPVYSVQRSRLWTNSSTDTPAERTVEELLPWLTPETGFNPNQRPPNLTHKAKSLRELPVTQNMNGCRCAKITRTPSRLSGDIRAVTPQTSVGDVPTERA